MPERHITVPADIILLDENDQPVKEPAKEGEEAKPLAASWKQTMLRVLAHPKLTGSTPVLKSHNLLKRKIKASEIGVEFAVPEEDWKRLADVLNNPDDLGGAGQGAQHGVNVLSALTRYAPMALPQLEEFFTAWTDAPSKPTAKPAEPT